VQEAARLIRTCYDPQSAAPVRPQDLANLLEPALDAPRGDWPTGLCRRLWDFLLEVADRRRLSPAHLNRWYNLVGFCLRPGFGDPLDRFRVEQLWKMMAAPPRGGAAATKAVEGGADWWILQRHILPNSASPIVVQASLSVGFAILAEASLSFLGLGVQPPDPSWGSMINTGRGYLQQAPWIVFGPGAALFVTVLGMNFVGDAVRDALDPRSVLPGRRFQDASNGLAASSETGVTREPVATSS